MGPGTFDSAARIDPGDRADPDRWITRWISISLESSGGEPIELGKTNFGFLGVRVAKTMSEQFGGGRVLNARGFLGETALMGEPGAWVDYSGPSTTGKTDGLCFMDHPSNPGHPVRWHVRADGWMGASFNRESGYGIAPDHPLHLLSIARTSGPAEPQGARRPLGGIRRHAAFRDRSAAPGQPGGTRAQPRFDLTERPGKQTGANKSRSKKYGSVSEAGARPGLQNQ